MDADAGTPEATEATDAREATDAIRIQPSADVDPTAVVGVGTTIWHLAQVREGAHIGAGCVIGRGAYVGPGVVLGQNCKVQNHALLYEPAVLEDGVFIGPAVVFTNDAFPRAINPDGSRKSAEDWHAVGVSVGTGASIGARAVCIAPVKVGKWALVAAGAVVTRDVADHAIVAGVPARQIGWVGRAGVPLQSAADGLLRCPVSGETYRELGGALSAVS
jgi:UDP-2-acetamido-3-amino-2,3-dideoxy-glucuronate N-acetyltransferase